MFAAYLNPCLESPIRHPPGAGTWIASGTVTVDSLTHALLTARPEAYIHRSFWPAKALLKAIGSESVSAFPLSVAVRVAGIDGALTVLEALPAGAPDRASP